VDYGVDGQLLAAIACLYQQLELQMGDKTIRTPVASTTTFINRGLDRPVNGVHM
jgi:hypothetical protein